jgi:predicted nucleotidyltransferase
MSSADNGGMNSRLLQQIAADHGVELLVQFGSTVTGTTHARSDVDLAVLFKEGDRLIDRAADLSVALPAAVPGEIDLAILNHADPLLLKQVTEHGVLLHGSPNRWQEFRAYAFKRYQDHRRFFEMERAYVERAIASARR